MSKIHVRPARRSDCVDIARLVLMSSDGIAEYIWGPLVVGRGSLVGVGTQRCARDDVPFSYQNCLIAEQNGRVAGSIHVVRVPMPLVEEDQTDPDPVLGPLAELAAKGSLEIRGLAVYPEFRGQGIAAMLVEAAGRHARNWGIDRLSVICFDGNEDALALYRRFGFREASRQPVTPHSALHYTTGDNVLMVRGTSAPIARTATVHSFAEGVAVPA